MTYILNRIVRGIFNEVKILIQLVLKLLPLKSRDEEGNLEKVYSEW